jgi:integrase
VQTNTTLADFFRDAYQPLRLRGRSQQTARLYGNTIRQFARWLERSPTLDDLDDLVVSRYLSHRAETRSPLTAEKERTQLLALARLSSDLGIRKTRPCVPPAPTPRRVPRAWTIEQLKSLVAATQTEPGTIGDVPARVFWTGLAMTLWESAERVGAILATPAEDYVRPRLLVTAEHRKGRRSDRLYSLSPACCDMLDTLSRANAGKSLFHWPLAYVYLWARFSLIIERAGLPNDRRNKFHAIRRAAATHYARLGGGIEAAARLLDHSSTRTTQQYYLDPRLLDTGPPPCDVLPRIDGTP